MGRIALEMANWRKDLWRVKKYVYELNVVEAKVTNTDKKLNFKFQLFIHTHTHTHTHTHRNIYTEFTVFTSFAS